MIKTICKPKLVNFLKKKKNKKNNNNKLCTVLPAYIWQQLPMLLSAEISCDFESVNIAKIQMAHDCSVCILKYDTNIKRTKIIHITGES